MPESRVPITVELLRAADSSNPDSYYASIVDAMDSYAQSYAVDTALRVAHFLSQIGHESGFRAVEENGSYGEQRMHQIFGCKGGSKNYDAARDDCTLGRLRDKLWTEPATYARNPKNLLSYAYASRLGNGDEASSDGYHYRGRGMIQLTGKANYAAFTAAHNAKNPDEQRSFVDDPDLIVTMPKFGVESAFFFWDARGLNAIADRDDATAVTIAVNGGTNGLPDREARLGNVKTVLGI